jgi:CheY-like chemotaxis protein
MDAGQLDLKQEPIHLAGVMDDVANLWSAKAAERGLTLRVEYEGPDLAALGDAVRLKQVLNNLVGNALKFTQTGGVEARLRASAEDGAVRLRGEICDTGVGVPEHRLQAIFQPFTQTEAGRAVGGAGLGLSICRELIQNMGGAIWAQPNPGGGLKVLFDAVLGLDQAPADAVEVVPVDAPGEAVLPPLRVLVADDNATNRLVAETLCAMFGCTSQSVEDGAQAVEALQAGAFDLVLMDIKMPVMDGVEATRRIRGGDGPASGLPIVALTANADTRDAATYLAAGMDTVVAKPIKPEALVNAMLQALEARRAVPAANAA